MRPEKLTAPDYVPALSLCCAPFEVGFDPKFFYASAALSECLDLLTQLTRSGAAVVVVTGPSGSGRSTLMERFVTRAHQQVQLCVLSGDAMELFPNQLARTLDIDSLTDELDAVTRWAAQTEPSQRLVFVVDNAEGLDQHACRRLTRLLEHPHHDRVGLLLFGDEDVEQRIAHALDGHAGARGVRRLEVPRLSSEETASYVVHRLAVAGYSGESPFTTTEVRGMCKAADGRPAAINRLADDALREHHLRASSRARAPRPSRHRGQGGLWASALLGVMAAGVYVGWQRFSTPIDIARELPQLARATPEGVIPLVLPPAAEETAPAETSRALPPWLDEATAAPVTQRPPPAYGASEGNILVETAGTAMSRPAPVDPGLSTGHEALPLSRASTATERGIEVPATSESATEAPAPPPVADIATTEAERPASPLTLAAAPVDAPAGGRPDAPHREAWLLTQPPDLYSLQLLGSRNEKAVVRFIEEHNLDLSKTAYYQGNFKDSEWFVLLYGLYPSRDAAIEARDALPDALRKSKPWPRSLESVHSAIRKLGP